MNKTVQGILFGVATGALWGVVFVTPQILSAFSPLEIAAGRFFFFGIMSLVSAKTIWRLFSGFSMREKIHAFLLSAAGFWFYTILLFWSVQYSGGVITTLLIGLLPVTIPLAGKKMRKLTREFMTGLALIVAGVVSLTLPGLLSLDTGGQVLTIKGFLCLVLSLALWTWYAIKNTQFLHRHTDVSRAAMAGMMGLFSFAAMMAVTFAGVDVQHLVARDDFLTFLAWTAFIGIACTWLANWLWNLCSSRCPASISGPLIVTETAFGLLFTFLYQQRLPGMHEALAILFFAVGVVLAIRAEIKAEN